MKIIDAHLHASFEKESVDFARKHGVDYSFNQLRRELNQSNVSGAILISGVFEPPTPIEKEHLCNLAQKDKRLFPVCAVNPNKVTKSGFEKFRKALKNKEVHGIKIFLGYYPYYATDKRYQRFYKLAEECDCPVIFHTGDTFGSQYYVKYTHPLQLDEIAVNHPKTRFVIAHMGNPWIRDTAEVVYKNPNMHADLSGLMIGTAAKQKHWMKQLVQDINYVFDYVSDPSKFMFGTDWPLINIKDYVKFMKKAIPRKHRAAFFYKNAKRVFNLRV